MSLSVFLKTKFFVKIVSMGEGESQAINIGTDKLPTKIFKLKEQRLNREAKDIVQMIEAFPEPVRIEILKRTKHFEFTDGCTGDCPWCAFDVNRKITSGFSFESIETFFRKYAKYLPDQLNLYWATDPTDIAGYKQDGSKYDYSDVLAAVLPNLRSDQYIVTSTSLPLGTDEVMEKVYRQLYEEWLKGKKHMIRISVKPETKDRVEALRKKLIDSGMSASYVDWQFSFNNYKSEDERTIKYAGKYFHHPKRDPFHTMDASTTACYDGCLFTTKGIKTITMEAVTVKNKYGQTQILLDPRENEFDLPRYIFIPSDRTDDICYYVAHGYPDKIQLLPEVSVDVVNRNGTVTKTKTIPSVRRDLQAIIELSNAIWKITQLPKEQKTAKTLVEGLKKCVELASSRFQQAIAKYSPSCDDSEALDLFKGMYNGIIDQSSQIKKEIIIS